MRDKYARVRQYYSEYFHEESKAAGSAGIQTAINISILETGRLLGALSLFTERHMTKQSDKDTKPKPPLFVFGLDENGKPIGARFPEVRDDYVSAALDMKCWVVYPATDEFVVHGMKLPAGRLYASGRAFIPNIRRALYDKLFATKGTYARRLATEEENDDTASGSDRISTSPPVRCISPITSGLPRSWDEIGVGHMVLVHESAEDGWWEAVVQQRELDVLTLRYRDYPKLPQIVRHVHAVAIVNPGPVPVEAGQP
jgi:hypothetical protein